MIYLKKPKVFNPIFEVGSCIIETKGEVLMLQTRRGKSQGEKWGVPAGKIGQNESALEATIRETLEETTIQLPTQEVKFVKKVYIKYPDYHYIYHIFYILLKTKPPVFITPEHLAFKWVSVKDILKLDLILDEDECLRLYYQDNLNI